MERVIEVFVELDGASHFAGRLWSRSLKGREQASISSAGVDFATEHN
jgi:hypothetical protein